ncbi:3-deoxy-manno-octulosonate cytidylyltransferase [Candidatus Thioglobus sp.]|jgi:3-deoxy-manno-octulosonate cytidylyltransferase (CMP-KDO synthetase)|uniref:3-deoxy-manno-octulosonate cytidylyltransferase n=1 Tax=Candidatus Thioglobus sp. TaxID=2026721 RepID=UPI001D744F07|nr:3-deoxy-manno-octulosonate cytidylyltransferase [Candidatus Thioglobus sp.]MBT3277024.1 3-deoxy-manno-octulosonate cytidylyltransferase [Candidatus Thioglobus sp.]MBT3447199.1 3-deoxy-manno-octulosonate cytidylyltransferase [Candidatus Thioglobus sp.]MBT4001446.1 3-deoxy-manno-octulosonate cytidylyltransferase [Candidatus Thioglobus sp.]MBT4181521.1 3-deoxy-manno-octulosonate cytidylyltransferase [Candidatus Thioglobus sp.]MBT4422087.1 3-deoxy-manno-octulosonate cytidylyltransferase [Candid
MNFSVIIPARYASSRLPAKLLKDIHGKPLIQHTYENALKSGASAVIIATDDQRIKTVAEGFGATVCMTDENHTSGTARISEVLTQLNIDDDEIVVNVQGDEPMLSASVIDQVANNLSQSQMQMATLCEQVIDKTQYLDPNCVKVVFDKFGKALYFSRAPIPYFREAQDFDLSLCYKHIGIYAYRSAFIKQYLNMDSSRFEQVEKLEQLTVLNEGFGVHVAVACADTGFGVDTQADLDQVRDALAKQQP